MNSTTGTKYELVDAETGNVYQLFLSQREALLLDYDKNRRYRMLNSLKEKNVAPSFKWDVSNMTASLHCESPSPSGSGHSSKPLATSSPITRPRATGKTGGIWKDDNNTKVFLQECIKRRLLMQGRTIEETVYQSISDSLFIHNIDYSSGQLRAKMKSLRRVYGEAMGKGLHGGSNWKFFSLMEALFPRDRSQLVIEDDCAKGLEHFDSIQTVNESNNEESVNVSEESLNLHLSTLQGSAADNTAWLHSPDRSIAGTSTNQGASHFSQDVEENQVHTSYISMEVSSDFLNINDSPMVNCTRQHNTLGATSIEAPSPPQDMLVSHNSTFVPSLNTSIENSFEALAIPTNDHETAAIDENGNVMEFRSPNRKKSNRDGTPQISIRLTPRKSPRRKLTTQTDMIWSQERLDLLLKECIIRKSKIQREKAPDSTWKEIAKALKDAEEDVTWTLCRDKYESVCKFFFGNLIRVGGVMGGTKCPYYDAMCELHDIPTDFLMPKEASTIAKNGDRLWSDGSIALLISLYKAKKGHFDGTESHVRHSLLYAEIAETMAYFNHTFTPQQVRSKWNDLKDTWNIEYDKTHKTGASPSTWKWYNDFDQIFGESDGAEAPFAFSSGTAVEYLVKGKNKKEVIRTTRTRTPVEPVSSGASKQTGPKKAAYKDRAMELQEKQLQLQEQKVQNQVTYLYEMQLMREEMAKTCAVQTNFLQMLLQQKHQQKEN